MLFECLFPLLICSPPGYEQLLCAVQIHRALLEKEGWNSRREGAVLPVGGRPAKTGNLTSDSEVYISRANYT